MLHQFFILRVATVKIIKMLTKIRMYPIFTMLLLYGIIAGSISYSMGFWNQNYLLNPLPVEISNKLYGELLIPYWKSTMNPSDYEYHNIINLETGKVMGQEKVPVFHFPFETPYLYLPMSVSIYALIGFGIELLRRSLQHKPTPIFGNEKEVIRK